MKDCKDMTEVRDEIDRVDRLIVPLLLERIELITQAGHIKTDRETVRDDWRVEDVVSKVKAETDQSGGDINYIETVYRFLIEYSIEHEFDVWDHAYGEGKKLKA